MNIVLHYQNLFVAFDLALLALFAVAAVLYGTGRHKYYWWLAGAAVAVRLANAIARTWAQHHVWAQDPFMQTLLRQPLHESVPLLGPLQWFGFLLHVPYGYYIYYAFGRFWLSLLLLLAVSLCIYLVLRLMRRYRSEALQAHEPVLALLCALLLGWPQVLLLVPLALFGTLGFAIGTLALGKARRVFISLPVLIATLVLLLWGRVVLELLHLSVLRV